MTMNVNNNSFESNVEKIIPNSQIVTNMNQNNNDNGGQDRKVVDERKRKMTLQLTNDCNSSNNKRFKLNTPTLNSTLNYTTPQFNQSLSMLATPSLENKISTPLFDNILTELLLNQNTPNTPYFPSDMSSIINVNNNSSNDNANNINNNNGNEEVNKQLLKALNDVKEKDKANNINLNNNFVTFNVLQNANYTINNGNNNNSQNMTSTNNELNQNLCYTTLQNALPNSFIIVNNNSHNNNNNNVTNDNKQNGYILQQIKPQHISNQAINYPNRDSKQQQQQHDVQTRLNLINNGNQNDNNGQIVNNKDEPQTVPIHKQPRRKSSSQKSISSNSSAPNSPNSTISSLNNTNNANQDNLNFSPINLQEQEVMKIEKKRERNREAARKCRTRKLEKIAVLEDRVKDLQDENTKIADASNELRDQINSLKSKLTQHKQTHGCELIPNNLNNFHQNNK